MIGWSQTDSCVLTSALVISRRKPRQRLERRVGNLHLFAYVLSPVCDYNGTVDVEGKEDPKNGQSHLELSIRQIGPATAAE